MRDVAGGLLLLLLQVSSGQQDCADSTCCHGQLVNGSCVCDSNWAGSTCAECAAGWAGEHCGQCDSGHTGPSCDQPFTNCSALAGCSGHGSCSQSDQCACEAGWSGPDCATAPCTGHGSWQPTDGSCRCADGWMGAGCGEPYLNCTHLDDCTGHGVCNRTDDTCICLGIYTGKRCELKDASGPAADRGTRRVGIGMYLMNLAEDSLAMGTFYADFLLFRFVDTRPLPEDYDIRNSSQVCDKNFPLGTAYTDEPFLINAGQYATLRLVEPKQTTNNASYYRVQSKFYRRIDVSQWPLTVPGYEISIRDHARTQDQLVFCHLERFTDFSPTLRCITLRLRLTIQAGFREGLTLSGLALRCNGTASRE